jgi:hypothetical protein
MSHHQDQRAQIERVFMNNRLRVKMVQKAVLIGRNL